jgi:hypothetical protein
LLPHLAGITDLPFKACRVVDEPGQLDCLSRRFRQIFPILIMLYIDFLDVGALELARTKKDLLLCFLQRDLLFHNSSLSTEIRLLRSLHQCNLTRQPGLVAPLPQLRPGVTSQTLHPVSRPSAGLRGRSMAPRGYRGAELLFFLFLKMFLCILKRLLHGLKRNFQSLMDLLPRIS